MKKLIFGAILALITMSSCIKEELPACPTVNYETVEYIGATFKSEGIYFQFNEDATLIGHKDDHITVPPVTWSKDFVIPETNYHITLGTERYEIYLNGVAMEIANWSISTWELNKQ